MMLAGKAAEKTKQGFPNFGGGEPTIESDPALSDGVSIPQVHPRSRVANILQQGDVVLELDRRPVHGIEELEEALQDGRALALRIYRSGRYAVVVVPEG